MAITFSDLFHDFTILLCHPCIQAEVIIKQICTAIFKIRAEKYIKCSLNNGTVPRDFWLLHRMWTDIVNKMCHKRREDGENKM